MNHESMEAEAEKVQFKSPKATAPVQLISAGHYAFRKIRLNDQKVKVK